MTLAAQLAGALGGAGLAALLVAPGRNARLAGLLAWGAGMALLALYLLPDVSRPALGAAAVGGVAVAVAGGWVLRRWPYLLAFGTLVCVPLRLPVDIGADEVNLLVPLYLVIASLAASIGWTLLRGDDRARELGPVAIPLAAFVLWTSASMLWTGDVRRGAIFVAAFLLPFGLLAIGFARLPWRGRWLTWLWGGVVAAALVFAAVGGYQWVTREVFWNPSVIVFNAYAPFFRVNSVFWDPSVYGRFLTVAILVSLAGIVLGGVRSWRLVALYSVVIATWLGLVISFSQSSFVALAVGIVVAASVAWGRKATLVLIGLVAAAVMISLAVPQVRHEVVGKSRSGIDKVTGGRSNLVGQGMRIALDNPLAGVGVGGFAREYGRRVGILGEDPRRVASHTTPVTVAAEGGVVGLLLLVVLLGAMFATTLRGLGRGFTSRVSLAVGVALVAIAVQSLFYAAFFEDPMVWALLGLAGLAARVPKKPGLHPAAGEPATSEAPSASPDPAT